MKKYLAILSFLLVLPLSVNAQTEQKPKTAEEAYKHAALALNQLLNDPIIQYAFDQTQQTLLRTNIDLTVGNFLDSNPLLRMIRPLLEASVKADVDAGIKKGWISMTELDPSKQNHIDQEVLEVAREVLRESGRPEKEVLAARIFLASGNINAYTFSSQTGPIAIVLQSGLLKELQYTRPEMINGQLHNITHVKKDILKAVFAHENGHIKSGHIFQGVENVAMMMQIFKYFAIDPTVDNGGGDNFSLTEIQKDLSHSMLKRMLPETANKVSSARRDSLQAAISVLNNSLDQVFSKNPDQVKSLLNPYLDLMIKIVMQNGEMKPGVLEGLVMLRSSTAVPKSQSPLFLKTIFSELAALMSREMETSADMYTFNSVGRLFGAAPFTMFQGESLTTPPELEKEYLGELVSAIEGQLKQSIKEYDNSTRLEIAAMLSGADVDHPQGPLRIENVLKYAQTLDAMVMQNEMLRLVVTHTALIDMGRNAQHNENVFQKKIDELKPLLAIANSSQLNEEFEAFKKLLVQQKELESQLKDKARSVTNVSLKMISQLGFDGPLASNPLLADTLDFHLARKVRNLWVRENLEKLLTAATTPEEKVEIQSKIDFYAKRFNDGDNFMMKVRAAARKRAGKGQNDAVIAKINAILDPKLTIENARQMRTEIALEAKFTDSITERRTHTPVGHEGIDIRGSSIKEAHISPEELAKIRKEQQAVVDRGNFADTTGPVSVRPNEGVLVPLNFGYCNDQLTGQLIKIP